VFRGWYIVAAVFTVMTVCSGLGVYCISVFLHGFVASGRFPIEQVSFASGGFAVASNVVGLWVGRLLALSFLLGMAAHVGGQTHVFNLLMQRLGDPAQAGSAVAMMAACSVLARFAAVAALRRISTRRFIMVLLALKGVALAGCGVATDTTTLLLWVALFGSTLGNFITAQSVLLAEAFGVTAYARLYGLSRVVATPGVLLGPGLMGVLYGLGQGYAMPYLAVAAVSLSGIVALTLCGPPPDGRDRA